jgi:hypothetical protein
MSRNDAFPCLAALFLLGACSSSSTADDLGEGTTGGSTSEAVATSLDDTTTGSGPLTSGETSDSTAAETGAQTQGTDTGDTEDTDALACSDGRTCTPAPPDGWSGPAVVHQGEVPSDCPDAFPDESFVAFDQLVADDPTCTCSCGSVTGATCNTVVRENAHSCVSLHFGQSWPLADDDGCIPIETSHTALRSDTPTLDVSNASCSAEPGEEIPEAEFQLSVKGCAARDPGDTCEAGGTCLPEAVDPYDEVCIYAEGDLACPAGPYSQRSLVHSSFEDTRGCSDCSCDPPTGSCSGSVWFWPACNIIIPPSSSGPAGTCQTMDTSPNGVSFGAEFEVSCQASSVSPHGEASPVEPITICCLP